MKTIRLQQWMRACAVALLLLGVCASPATAQDD
jgi:hypothetical protein